MSWQRQCAKKLPPAWVRAIRCWRAPRIARRFTDADWEYAEWARSIIQPGDTVLDVGANMGYITARLADYVGPAGRVIAFEPVPDTYQMLEATVRGLHLQDRVQTHRACVSDQAGDVEMAIPEYQNGGENLYESHIIRSADADHPAGVRRILTPAVSLDDVVPDEMKVRFIKIDVEGHELEVIRGAQRILTRWKPDLLIEISGDPDLPGSAANTLFGQLGDMGYQPFVLNEGKLERRVAGQRPVDVVFVHADRD
jgi:FkbM family methyltransferase